MNTEQIFTIMLYLKIKKAIGIIIISRNINNQYLWKLLFSRQHQKYSIFKKQKSINKSENQKSIYSVRNFITIPNKFKSHDTEIMFSFQKLLCLPKNMFEKYNLNSLDINVFKPLRLYLGRISNIPSQIFINLQNLYRLAICDNQIISIPSEIGTLKNLNELILNNNKIITLPSEIYKLTGLTELNIEKNNIAVLKNNISKLINLQYLNISSNELTVLSPKICFLTNLEILYFKNNKILKYPKNLYKLINLRKLSVNEEICLKLMQNKRKKWREIVMLIETNIYKQKLKQYNIHKLVKYIQ